MNAGCGTAVRAAQTWWRRPALLLRLLPGLMPALWLGGCATESARPLPVTPVAAALTPYDGPRLPLAVGRFQNQTLQMRGVFSDGVDTLGGQARTVLLAHLRQAQRFVVLDRDNLAQAASELQRQGRTPATRAADFLVAGEVTEFGRREVGDQQLYGILGKGKQQLAYAKVTLNIVDAQTSEIVYAAQGAGEVALSSRQVIGTGSSAGHDATLNGKVLDLAIREAVNALVAGYDAGRWTVSAPPR